ncbi:hypothetical protein [Microbacterium immunditiarum]|uniref:Phenylalanyl-tRNA synthetase subunit beta n=1 Tax=Microbacterium immunditiarum TaxID=337480 RepID=A0A7Y9KG38_9MICO|nr:hypothetical protein [Microbacterium immunditiarum]NYE18022.1 hypothetical protein [Microbacterium immunditiarum]
MDERILERVARDGELQTLSPLELQLNEAPLTIDPTPRRRVKAWVRFGSTPIQVDALAARWTSNAVGIVFEVRRREMRCWVWSGAVTEME